MKLLSEYGNRLAKDLGKNALIIALLAIGSCEHIQRKQAETKLKASQVLKP